MKKNYNFLLIVLMIGIGLTACKKDRDDKKKAVEQFQSGLEVKADGKTYLVSKISSSDQDYLTTNYDDKGRLLKYSLFEDGNLETQSDFIYNGNTVIINNTTDGDKSTATVTLGSNGYAKEATETYIIEEGGYTYTTKAISKITQNSEGYVTNIEISSVDTSNDPNSTDTNYSVSSKLTYSGGNLVSDVITAEGLVFTEAYEYYDDKPSVPFMFEQYTNFLLGKPSKNLVKKITRSFEAIGQSSSENSTYIYTYNGNGLPISATNDSGDKTTIQYIAK